MTKRPLIDTGVLLALLDATDTHHVWAKKTCTTAPKGFATCEAVLAELFFHIQASARAKHAVFAMLEADWLRILPVAPGLRVGVAHIVEKYHPAADYADACLVALHEQLEVPVFTTDKRHFLHYRTRGGSPVAACTPP